MQKLDDLTLKSLVTPSISRDKNIQAIIKAIDTEIKSLNDAIKNVLIYARIDDLPEDIIDLLAWQWHVDFYEHAKTLEAKRKMVKTSIEWHRHKGTAYAIIQGLDFIDVEAKFIPWYQELESSPGNINDLSQFPVLSGNESLLTERVITQRDAYTFSIDAKLNNEFWERVDWNKASQSIKDIITASKAARSFLSSVYIHFEDYSQKELHLAQVTPQGIFRRVELSRHEGRNLTQKIHTGQQNITAQFLKVELSQENQRELNQKVIAGDAHVQSVISKLSAAYTRERNLTQKINTGNLSTGGVIL